MTDASATPDDGATEPETTRDEPASDESTPSSASDGADDPDRTLVRPGRNFEREYHVAADEAADFLTALGEQLAAGETLCLQTDEWELPFEAGDDVELEVEFEGTGDPELEIEVTIQSRADDEAPDLV